MPLPCRPPLALLNCSCNSGGDSPSKTCLYPSFTCGNCLPTGQKCEHQAAGGPAGLLQRCAALPAAPAACVRGAHAFVPPHLEQASPTTTAARTRRSAAPTPTCARPAPPKTALARSPASAATALAACPRCPAARPAARARRVRGAGRAGGAATVLELPCGAPCSTVVPGTAGALSLLAPATERPHPCPMDPSCRERALPTG